MHKLSAQVGSLVQTHAQVSRSSTRPHLCSLATLQTHYIANYLTGLARHCCTQFSYSTGWIASGFLSLFMPPA
jgi:hypothetical protein